MISQRMLVVGFGSALAVCVGVAQPQAHGLPLLGSDMNWSRGDTTYLYDVDPLTGEASNPRDTGVWDLFGIAYSPQGVLYGLTAFSGPAWSDNSLFVLDPATAEARFVGDTGLTISEGGLAFHPGSGELYGLAGVAEGVGVDWLFRIDTETGVATRIADIPGDPNVSGMAFDPQGRLCVLDTTSQEALVLDPTDASLLWSAPLSVPLGVVCGMDVDPLTGVFYAADGESGGTMNLYTLDIFTGELTLIGPTGLEHGLSGLAFIPEPGSLALVFAGAVGVMTSRRRPTCRRIHPKPWH